MSKIKKRVKKEIDVLNPIRRDKNEEKDMDWFNTKKFDACGSIFWMRRRKTQKVIILGFCLNQIIWIHSRWFQSQNVRVRLCRRRKPFL